MGLLGRGEDLADGGDEGAATGAAAAVGVGEDLCEGGDVAVAGAVELAQGLARLAVVAVGHGIFAAKAVDYLFLDPETGGSIGEVG